MKSPFNIPNLLTYIDERRQSKFSPSLPFFFTCMLTCGLTSSFANAAVPNATVTANNTANCFTTNGAAALCTLESWGIDLNEHTGYRWAVNGGTGGTAQVYFKVASLSGTRSMSLWANAQNVSVPPATKTVVTTNSTLSPRPTGSEVGPYNVVLNSGTNTIELRDTEGVAELDVTHVRIVGTSSSSSSSSSGMAFTARDIGAVGKIGSSLNNNGTYTIKAAGQDIMGNGDQFHFLHAPIAGNGEVIANIQSLTETNTWSKVGLMIRNGLDPAAQNAFIFVRPSQGSAFQNRPALGAITQTTWMDNPPNTSSLTGWMEPDAYRVRYLKPNKWLRLIKNGNQVTSYSSNDGKCWVIRSRQDVLFSSSNLLAGIALTSHDNTQLATAVVSGLQVKNTAPTEITEVNKDCDRAQVDGRVAEPATWISPPAKSGISNWAYTTVDPSTLQRPASCVEGDNPANRRYHDYDLICPAKTTVDPWANIGFTYNSNWVRNKSMGFGMNSTPSPTPVTGKEMWLRGEVLLNQDQIDNLTFWGRWAEGVSIFVNGVSATAFDNVGDYRGIGFYLGLSPKARQALKPGVNVFAVYAKCAECVKGGLLDFGIAYHPKMAKLPITNRLTTPGTMEARYGDLFIDFTNRTGALGGSLAMLKNGQLVESVAIGWRDISLNEPLLRDSIMRFSSSDKRFLDAMLVNLYRENGVHPDAKVFGPTGILSHIQPYNGIWGVGIRDITVEQLRTGASGLPETGDSQPWIDHTSFLMGIHTKDFNAEQRMRYNASLNTVFPPGTKDKVYSNTAYGVIPAIRQKVTGKSAEAYFTQDMSQTGVMETSEYLLGRPGDLGKKVGYQTIGSETHDRWATLAGALTASTETMVQFLTTYAPNYDRVGTSLTFNERDGGHAANMQGTRGGLSADPVTKSGIAHFWNSDLPGTGYFDFEKEFVSRNLVQGSCNPLQNLGARFRMQNFWRPQQFIMMEPLEGTSTPFFGIRPLADAGAESAKWTFHAVPGSPGYYLIKGLWPGGIANPYTLVQQVENVTALQGIADTNQAAHWKLVDSGTYFLIESRTTPTKRLNFENEILRVSAFGEGSHSTRWWLCN